MEQKIRETLIEIHNELSQIKVSGIDVEHMYIGLSKLTSVINASIQATEEREK